MQATATVQPRATEHAQGPESCTPTSPLQRPGAGQEAPPGRGAAGRAGRLFRALARCPGPARQAAQEKAPLTKGGSVQTPRLWGWGAGRRRRGRRRLGPTRRAAADTAPGGHQREAGTAVHRRGSGPAGAGGVWGAPVRAQRARP